MYVFLGIEYPQKRKITYQFSSVQSLSHVWLFATRDGSPQVSSAHGILQARLLEWVAISFSRDQTQVSLIAGRRFNLWATREAQQPRCP